ncbi:hypothetical protein LCE44_04945 [Vibrio harveyi]|uniref:hypothetical protein n=1 Tax=Vibrio harveyi TaxID=669 RepID=UPI003BF69057
MMRALLKEFAGSNKRFERKEEGRPIFLKRKSEQQLVWLKAPWYLKFFLVNLIKIIVLAIVNIFIITSFHLSEIKKCRLYYLLFIYLRLFGYSNQRQEGGDTASGNTLTYLVWHLEQ